LRRFHERDQHKEGKSIAMNEFLPSSPATENGTIYPAEFITCLNGYPQAPADTFESAIALAHEFWLFRSEQAISIYDVRTGIHYDLDLAVMITSRQLWDGIHAS
jgi:hypothetical protein